jgi:hypothetical protein
MITPPDPGGDVASPASLGDPLFLVIALVLAVVALMLARRPQPEE